MRNRVLVLLWLAGMIGAGFAVGSFQERLLWWNADRTLADSLNIRPEALPVFSADQPEGIVETGLQFQEVHDSGVSFSYENGPAGQYHLAETLGGGVGALDIDHDLQPDLIFVDGGDPATWPSHRQSRVAVYRNQGDTQFASLASVAGIEWTGYGHGCAIADVDNDGFDDVLITGYQQSALFLNQGDGTFEENSAIRQLTGNRWCATGCWSDLDRDGDLDLYVACYADTPRELPTPVCMSGDVRIHCNPHSYRAVADLLFENAGDGSFIDRSESSGIAGYREYGLGVMAADMDSNGTPEIFVANDGDRNLLFRQTEKWKYEEIAITSGVAFNGQGETMGSMGVACADFDRNGRLDLLTTNFSHESNALFHQVGELTFVDNTQGNIVDRTSRAMVGWSAITLDADNDSNTDLFVANGHVTQMPAEDWAQRSSLLRGGPDGFEEVRNVGQWFETPWHARGASRVDLNGDGLDDLVVSLIDTPAALLVNKSPKSGHRIQLRLIGTTSARSAEGASMELKTASGNSIHIAMRNAGYLSSNSSLVTLGLGTDTVADVVRIHWVGGTVQELSDIASGQTVNVIEGRTEPLR